MILGCLFKSMNEKLFFPISIIICLKNHRQNIPVPKSIEKDLKITFSLFFFQGLHIFMSTTTHSSSEALFYFWNCLFLIKESLFLICQLNAL